MAGEQSQPVAPVPVETRYLAAWNEMNVRIAQRQNLITIYVTLALAVLGAASGSLRGITGSWRLAYLVPGSTVMFTSLLYMHEKMIHNLQVFLAKCEGVSHPKGMPEYHKWSNFTMYAARARVIHDYVCAGLVIGFNGMAAALIAVSEEPRPLPYDPPIQVFLIVVVGVALIQIKRISAFRHKPEQGLDPVLSARP